MIAHTAKVMPILSSVLVRIGFLLTSCVGINLGDIPWGLRHPRDVPSVDPSTLGGRKTLYALASLKYCYNTETALSSEWSISQAFKSASASHSFFLPLPLSLKATHV